jgi:hypothetical protein
MLDQHFFCIQDVTNLDEEDDEPVSKPAVSKKDEALNNIFAGIKEATTTEPAVSKTEIKEEKPAVDDTDAKLKELLASL